VQVDSVSYHFQLGLAVCSGHVLTFFRRISSALGSFG